MSAGDFLFAVNGCWLFVNGCISVMNWRASTRQDKFYAARAEEADEIRNQAISLLRKARLLDFRVCPNCQKIVEGPCLKCQPVPSSLN